VQNAYGLLGAKYLGEMMSHFRSSVVLTIALTLVLSGCIISPDRDLVRVRNEKPKDVPLADLRSGTLPSEIRSLSQYAFLSAAAYVPNPNPERLCVVRSNWKQRWQKVPGYNHNNLDLFPKTPEGRIKIPGIGFQMWEDKSARRNRRFALVFRGTDSSEFGDWYSNARWITRIDPNSWDQYQQARDLVGELKKKMPRDFGENFEIITAGHSLGGGLAQQAAYTWDRIKLTYAFATSPVTGSSSIDTNVTPEARRGLKIFRIYEAGEVLATPRAIARSVTSLKQSNPKITEVRFNFRSTFGARGNGGGLVRQHSIEQLACDILCRVEQGKSIDQCGTHPN